MQQIPVQFADALCESAIAVCFQQQVLLQRRAGFVQNFVIAEFQGIIGHGLALLGLLVDANNHTRFEQARQVLSGAEHSRQIWIY